MNNGMKAALVVHGLFAARLGSASVAPASARVMVGGAPMFANKDIIDVIDRVPLP